MSGTLLTGSGGPPIKKLREMSSGNHLGRGALKTAGKKLQQPTLFDFQKKKTSEFLTSDFNPTAEEVVSGEFPGYITHSVPANGDCLFSSIAHQLSLDTGREPASSSKIRQDIVTYIETHKSLYDDVATAGFEVRTAFDKIQLVSFDEYITYMRQERSWGDGMIISAASQLYNRCISVACPTGVIIKSDNINIEADQRHPHMYLGLMVFGDRSKVGLLNNTVTKVNLDHYVSLIPTALTSDSAVCAKYLTAIDTQIPDSRSLNSPSTAGNIIPRSQLGNVLEAHTDSAPNDIADDNSTDLFPNVCSTSQFRKWKETRPWISAKRLNNSTTIGITCTTCSAVGSLSHCMSTKERISISEEWMKGITARNSKKLHDKMTDHEKTHAHEFCVQEVKLRSKKHIEESTKKAQSVWHERNAQKIEVTARIFRTAYTIAWKHLAFNVHRNIVELQGQNGLDMGSMLFSHHACCNIIKFIASDMSKKLVQFLLMNDVPFSLMMDESTTMSNKTALIIYIRMLNTAGIATNCFLDLCELTEGQSGQSIANALLKSLCQMGIDDGILSARLLGFCTDGASNLHGHVKGALQVIAETLKRDDLFMFHCMNHKLELAVHDAVSSTNKVSHLRMFMDTLYAYYSRSPDHCRMVESVSETLDTDMRKIGKVFDVRWLSSSYRSVDAVYSSYPALIGQLTSASVSPKALSKDKTKANGMIKRMQSFSFVAEIALMRDVLEVLQGLSLYLQKRSASVIDAKDRFDTDLRSLAALKIVDGLTLKAVKKQINESGTFAGISVTRTESDEDSFTQMRLQFIQALIDNLKSRFPEQNLLEAGACLSPTSWPKDAEQQALFGDQEVINLAKLCHVESRSALDDFRQYKNNTQRVGQALKALLQRISLLPISSADCERGFSCMNMSGTAVRNRLAMDSMCALIFIKTNGPHPTEFNCLPYVEHWLKENHHAASDAPTGKQRTENETVSSIASLFS